MPSIANRSMPSLRINIIIVTTIFIVFDFGFLFFFSEHFKCNFSTLQISIFYYCILHDLLALFASLWHVNRMFENVIENPHTQSAMPVPATICLTVNRCSYSCHFHIKSTQTTHDGANGFLFFFSFSFFTKHTHRYIQILWSVLFKCFRVT